MLTRSPPRVAVLLAALAALAACSFALSSQTRCGPDSECAVGATCVEGKGCVFAAPSDVGTTDGGTVADGGGDDDGGAVVDGGAPPDDDAGAADGGGDALDDAGPLDAGQPGDAGPDAGPWHVAGALHRVRVMFDDGAVDAPLQDVPVLVEPSAAMLVGMREDGQDIVAVDQDGTVLPIDLEGFVGSVPRAIWVGLPDLPADTAGRWCWLYYGGPAVPPSVASSSVWARYGAVWHGDAVNAVDRTGTQAIPSCDGACPTVVTGKIGEGWSFTTDAGYLNVQDDDELDVDDGEARTISLWFKVPGGNTDRPLVWKENSCRGWIIQLDGDGDPHGRLSLNTSNDGVCTDAIKNDVASSQSADDNQWHHVTMVVDRSADMLALYVDGALSAQASTTSTLSADGLPLLVGANWDAALRMSGTIDELRVSSFAESAAWVKAQHRSMIGQLAVIGAVEDAY